MKTDPIISMLIGSVCAVGAVFYHSGFLFGIGVVIFAMGLIRFIYGRVMK